MEGFSAPAIGVSEVGSERPLGRGSYARVFAASVRGTPVAVKRAAARINLDEVDAYFVIIAFFVVRGIFSAFSLP